MHSTSIYWMIAFWIGVVKKFSRKHTRWGRDHLPKSFVFNHDMIACIFTQHKSFTICYFFSSLLFNPSYTFHTTSLGQWRNTIPSFAQGLNLVFTGCKTRLKICCWLYLWQSFKNLTFHVIYILSIQGLGLHFY